MELSILAVVLGFVLDLLIGDPHWLYHPIRLVGALISALEKLLRGVFPKNKNGELDCRGISSGADCRDHHRMCLGTSVSGRPDPSLGAVCPGDGHVLPASCHKGFEG